jgi:hypothetical protein|tara:strand:- start:322 stop:759 length:438 start_codon:yes stop_codon:yes gene_type:complete
MGHPIHKHMNSGMSRASSAEKFDAKEAYNKDLSSKARMHYLENDIADKKGMSRYSVEKGPHAPHGDAPHRKSSPANNLNKGYKSQMGKPSVASMNVDPAEAVMSGKADTREGAGGMSRYKKDHKGMSRAKYGGNKGDESKSKRDY